MLERNIIIQDQGDGMDEVNECLVDYSLHVASHSLLAYSWALWGQNAAKKDYSVPVWPPGWRRNPCFLLHAGSDSHLAAEKRYMMLERVYGIWLESGLRGRTCNFCFQNKILKGSKNYILVRESLENQCFRHLQFHLKLNGNSTF